VQTISDLDIPDVKPAIELYRGVRRRKMSPQFTHALLQSRLMMLVGAWAAGRGRVGPEWRFYFLEGDGEPSSSLVPDVAYVSFERLPYDADDGVEQPLIAPDIAFEVLSPGERPGRVDEKIALYRAYGTACVVIVDPAARSVTVYDHDARQPRVYAGAGEAEIAKGLRIDLDRLFAPVDPPSGA